MDPIGLPLYKRGTWGSPLPPRRSLCSPHRRLLLAGGWAEQWLGAEHSRLLDPSEASGACMGPGLKTLEEQAF